MTEECALGIEIHGVAVAVHASSACLLDRLLALLPPDWRPIKPALARHSWWIVEEDYLGECATLRVGTRNRTLIRTPDVDDAIAALEDHLSLYVAEHASPAVFVHAGAVGWEGGVIVVPGRTLAGKTTLVAALVDAGGEYYSDEFAVIGADGLVHPYARPPSFRPPHGGRAHRDTVETKGWRLSNKPAPISMVVAARYIKGQTWSPAQLSAGETVIELFANTVSARRQPVEALALLQRATCGAKGVKGSRGEAHQTVEAILDVISRKRVPNRVRANSNRSSSSERPATVGALQGVRTHVSTGPHGRSCDSAPAA